MLARESIHEEMLLIYSILLFLPLLLIPDADIISFEFFSIQLRASVT